MDTRNLYMRKLVRKEQPLLFRIESIFKRGK